MYKSTENVPYVCSRGAQFCSRGAQIALWARNPKPYFGIYCNFTEKSEFKFANSIESTIFARKKRL